MSKSPFQFPPPEIVDDVAPLRRLQSPVERFGAAETGREDETSPFDESFAAPQSDANATSVPEDNDAELELPATVATAPDPFERLPDARTLDAPVQGAPRGRRGAESRRARRRLKQQAPHYHEKKPHTVAHKPIKPGAQSGPPSEWDTAAQNSMARAALARKKGRVRRVVGRVALAASVLFLVWGVGTALTAPQFDVNRVEITGTRGAPPLKAQNLARELIGQNVFRAPKSRIETELRAIPVVADAHISRAWSWPPHMRVQITERQPILQVGSGTTWWVADAQGVAFRRADRNDSALDMLTSPDFKPVTGKALPAAQWKSARELEETLSADNALVARESGGKDAGKFWDLRRVYLDANSAAALRISGKGALKAHGETLIRLGEEGWPEKLKQARVALAFFERTGRKASEIDLVSSEHPRWLPKTQGPTPTPEAEEATPTPQD